MLFKIEHHFKKVLNVFFECILSETLNIIIARIVYKKEALVS